MGSGGLSLMLKKQRKCPPASDFSREELNYGYKKETAATTANTAKHGDFNIWMPGSLGEMDMLL